MLDLDQIKGRLEHINNAEMARELKITTVYLSYLRTGRRVNPSYEMLKRISDYIESHQ